MIDWGNLDWTGSTPNQITEFDSHSRRTFSYSFTFQGVFPAATYRVASIPDGAIGIRALRHSMDRLARQGLGAPASG